YDADPEAPAWAHLTGKDDDPDAALEDWLDNAREYAAVDEIPPVPCRYTVERVSQPVEVVLLLPELAAQELAERERQRGWGLEYFGAAYRPGTSLNEVERDVADERDASGQLGVITYGPPEAA